MKLPYSENAYVPKEKLLGYLLSETHPIGKFKAKFFRKLGFNETNVEKLEQYLLSIAQTNEIDEMKETPFGINYTIKGFIKFPHHIGATIKTIWFIESGTMKPRFVTAIPDIINKRKEPQK